MLTLKHIIIHRRSKQAMEKKVLATFLSDFKLNYETFSLLQ